MSPHSSAEATETPLAIICGGGSFPTAVADAVAQRGRRVVLFPIRGWADAVAAARYPHHWIELGQFGKFRRAAQAEGCRDVVFIGNVLRPSIKQLRPDLSTLRLMPRIVRLLRRGGDDRLLTGIGGLFEEHGFNLVGAHQVAPEILIAPGVLGRIHPTADDLADIRQALDLLTAIGRFDIGQGAVVAGQRVLAIEAAEGTDGILARVASLREAGRIARPARTGVLVKAPKPGQDRRIDLPSIGPSTVEGAARAGLAGIAVVAGGTIAAEAERLVKGADEAGLFVVGVHEDGTLG